MPHIELKEISNISDLAIDWYFPHGIMKVIDRIRYLEIAINTTGNHIVNASEILKTQNSYQSFDLICLLFKSFYIYGVLQ